MKDKDFFDDIEYLLKAWSRDANSDDYSMDIEHVLSELDRRRKEQEIFFASLHSK